MASAGKLFIVSAPSGAGKTTLISKVLNRFENLSYSVSHTTRSPRKNEQEGSDYYFISTDDFERKIARELWLEWAKVHDNFYGTSKETVKNSLEKGQSIILDIDVQGAKQIMALGLDMVSIFIMPPSFEVLSQRLKTRGTDTIEVIANRLDNAKSEIAQKEMYQYVVVNDNLETAAEELYSIFKKEMALP